MENFLDILKDDISREDISNNVNLKKIIRPLKLKDIMNFEDSRDCKHEY